jgi:hypothetical protein
MTQSISGKSLKDESIKKEVKFETIAAPGIILKYIEDNNEMADVYSIYAYRSGVGKLLYLTK